MTDVMSLVHAQRVIAIVRERDAATAAAQVCRLSAAGLRLIEISLVTPGALEAIESVRERVEPGTIVGAGTVLTRKEAKSAAAAGAEYVVSPILSRDVLRACFDLGLPAFPGVATPTEAWKAVSWGAAAAKIFPATLWTPTVLRDLLTAMPGLPTVPTGGITLGNAAAWIAAGATAVGLGSTLTRSPDLEAAARSVLQAVSEASR
jgi:2-dehydro-3-deoxyphosphogluconate aldolase/(4S)-4-hydroxy-2-oxoglutarate aldolase